MTGERPEPTFLITKPFREDAVKAIVSQVLFFDQQAQRRAETAQRARRADRRARLQRDAWLLPTVRATIASVEGSGPNSRAVDTPSSSASLARARLTRLLMVPTAQPEIAAASS